MVAITFHKWSRCISWPHYHRAYLIWMQKVNHPDLRISNYNRLHWEERNLNRPIPVMPEREIYGRFGG